MSKPRPSTERALPSGAGDEKCVAVMPMKIAPVCAPLAIRPG